MTNEVGTVIAIIIGILGMLILWQGIGNSLLFDIFFGVMAFFTLIALMWFVMSIIDYLQVKYAMAKEVKK